MNSEKIVVVGAGLCGTLMAIRLAQKGYQVELYEKRPDMRRVDISAGRSINLALSDRGFRALDMIGISDSIREQVIPMKGRMIHPVEGNSRFSPYSGRETEHINSVSRGGLNIALLDLAEEQSQLDIFFEHKCTSVHAEAGEVVFTDGQDKQISTRGDLIIGADGAGSAVRRAFMKNSGQLRFNYSQKFLEHGYKELSIPAGSDNSHRIEKNALHIWPRGTYMLIALPNLDGSFTVTLFLPFEGPNSFEQLNKPAQVEYFFKEHFPDALEQMPGLKEEYFEHPTSALGTIRCYPWRYDDNVLLLGDAAHAIVPFYGQGMNAAFEDCVLLDHMIDDQDGEWKNVMEAYQELRKKDTDAIADLAEDNFYEMRDHVANPVFARKRVLEMKLESEYSNYYSKYSLVTFREEIPYSVAKERGRKQDELLLEVCREHESIDEINTDELIRRIQEEVWNEA